TKMALWSRTLVPKPTRLPQRANVMIAHDSRIGNDPDTLFSLVTDLQQFACRAAQDGTRVDLVEQGILDRLLTLGRHTLHAFFHSLGTGHLGQHVALPDGTIAQRLAQTHARSYRSLFGDFTLDRTCYGSREGQKITFVPLDNRLQLPASDYSYLLQKWNA